MSDQAGARRAIGIVRELKEAVAACAAREAELETGLLGRTNTAERHLREGIKALDEDLEAGLALARGAHHRGKSEADRRYSARRAWIDRASRAARRDAPHRAEEMRGTSVSALQMKQFRAERDRAKALGALDEALGSFRGEMEGRGVRLAALEKRTRRSFAGYPRFRRCLREASIAEGTSPDTDADAGDRNDFLLGVDRRLDEAEAALDAFRRFRIPKAFSWFPPPVLLVAVAAATVPLIAHFHWRPVGLALAGVIVAIASILVLLLHRAGARAAGEAGKAAAQAVAGARRCHDEGLARAESHGEDERRRIEGAHERIIAEVSTKWSRASTDAEDFAAKLESKIEEQLVRLIDHNERQHRDRLEALESARAAESDRVAADIDRRRRELEEAHQAEIGGIEAERAARWSALEGEWKATVPPLYAEIEAIQERDAATFPAWSDGFHERWTPPGDFAHAAKFGWLEVDVEALAGRLPTDARLALPGPARFDLPLALSFPHEGSILLETDDDGRAEAVEALNDLVLRLLVSSPAGRLRFTLIDPVGLGQSFAAFMHLADYDELLVNHRIWTRREQIDEKLGELGEHMEKIIQIYLRDDYETITGFNEAAGNIAERYQFLVVADFPAGFDEGAVKRIHSIATSGARCGVFTLVHWDRRQPAPDALPADDLRAASLCLRFEDGAFRLAGEDFGDGARLVLESPPAPDAAIELIHRIGRASVDANRVEVPFHHVAPAPEDEWRGDTADELRVAIGRTGATKLQHLAIGKGTRQHALFAGKTGSGKSTLFHVIITNLALRCRPDQVEFYLIDFKKGVEFKCYAEHRLPHARVVAIESDREFGLSVLHRVDEELKRRGDLFRAAGVQDLAGFRRSPRGATEPLPRTLLVIDEFQEFFVEDDAVAQTASVLLDRIVRQGRAFGIHVLLGSQTLGGAYSLARATLGQMVIRVALQCNEADAMLIMDDNNPAPRLLSRPGEGIYNDAAGAVEGNSPFQVVWLPEDERDAVLARVRQRADEELPGSFPGPIVFEGNLPAEVRDNAELAECLARRPQAPTARTRVWLGAPNAIKGPTQAVFVPRSGSNLLVVGQVEEAELVIVGLALLAIAAQHPVDGARLVLVDSTVPQSPEREFIDRIVAAVPHPITMVRQRELAEVMDELAAEMTRREAAATTEGLHDGPVFLLVHALQRHKKLRNEEDFGSFSLDDDEDEDAGGGNPGAKFERLVCEGPSLGMHVLATIDTGNNVSRFLSRKSLSEFEMRVLFQMSANDSASLVDSPKAAELGLHRALFHSEQEGYDEIFRPYAMPSADWVAEAGRRLAEKPGRDSPAGHPSAPADAGSAQEVPS